MKTKFTLLAVFVAAFLTGFAQQPTNGSFEIWTQPVNPDGWTSVENLLGDPSVNILTFKDTAHTDGSFSVRLVSDTITGQSQAGIVPGILSLGSGALVGPSPEFNGIPFTYRPDTLVFDYKYSSPGTDTGAIFLSLTKSAAGVIGYGGQPGIGLALTSHTGWMHVAVPLQSFYLNLNIPDTLEIQLYSSNTNNPVIGSTLTVDNVRFGYATLQSTLTATITGNGPTTFCAGGSVTLQANTGNNYTYQWMVGGATITGATAAQYVATTSGSYTVQIDSANAAGTSAATVVTVNQPAVSLTGLNDTVCSNAAAITLTGGSPTGGTYLGSGVVTTTFTPSAATLGLDTIKYTATDANNCTGTASATVLVQVCTGIDNISAVSLSVYPNPASSLLNINSDVTLAGFNLQMFDIVGQLVISQVLDGTNNTVNVAKLANGTYIYRITDKENGVVSQNKFNVIK